jgi:hypothetical protein
MGLNSGAAIKVDSVSQEYNHIGLQRCACGGRWRPTSQALLREGDKHFDLIKAVCQKCGLETEFLFDVSSFFGPPSET